MLGEVTDFILLSAVHAASFIYNQDGKMFYLLDLINLNIVFGCYSFKVFTRLKISWQKRGQQHPLTASIYSFFSNGKYIVERGGEPEDWNLIIDDVRKLDRGTYLCKVTTRTMLLAREVKLRVRGMHWLCTHIAFEFIEASKYSYSILCAGQVSPLEFLREPLTIASGVLYIG